MIRRMPMSEETKQKISDSMRKKFPRPILTEEHKQKLIIHKIADFLRHKREELAKSK